jgi:hypothetical protein
LLKKELLKEMSNTEESFDGHESSDGEEKKTYESILSNPSYFSATMKVRIAFYLLAPFKHGKKLEF